MKKLTHIFAVIATILTMACDSESLYLPEREKVVVRAYLYAGEPVTDIQLTTTFSIFSEDSIGDPINNASVTLEKNGREFRLISSPGDSGFYHYRGNDLVVENGDHFGLKVEYNGQTSFSETHIPSPPKDVTLSSNQYVITQQTNFDATAITVNWTEEKEAIYFVTVNNAETNQIRIDAGNENNFRQSLSFRSRLVPGSSYSIRRSELTYLGKHVVRVYKINREYANLYTFGNQDSRNLNEPATNIHNGLGVFAGFSSDFVEFNVTRE